MANTLFSQVAKAHHALMMIMTLCLLVYGALEYRIAKHLNRGQQNVSHPTRNHHRKAYRSLVFQFFTGIHVLLIAVVEKLY